MPSPKRRLQASSSPVGIGHSSVTAVQSAAPPAEPLPPVLPPLPPVVLPAAAGLPAPDAAPELLPALALGSPSLPQPGTRSETTPQQPDSASTSRARDMADDTSEAARRLAQ